MKHKQSMSQQQLRLQRDQLGLQRENQRARHQAANLAVNQLTQMKTPKLSATERKSEIDAKEELFRAIELKKEVNHLGKLVKQTSTGPIIGGIKSYLPKTKIDNRIDVRTSKLILEMHQGMKNIPRGEKFMERIEATKPNRSNYPEANEDSLDLMNKGADIMEKHNISTLLSLGWSPQKIEKQFKVKVPKHFLEESSSEGLHPSQEIPEEEGGIINMIDPDGNPLQVPYSEVNQALNAGATIG